MHARLAFCALLFAACGGSSDKSYGDPITLDASTKAGITGAIDSTTSLSSVDDTPTSDSTLAKVSGLYSAMAVLPTACQAHRSGLADVAELLAPMHQDLAGAKPVDTTCVTATTGKVTYANCNYGSGTINGTVSYSADAFTVDLKMTISSGGYTTTITEKGSITVSASAIAGDLKIGVDATFGTTKVTGSYDASYDITLSNKCATGGTMEVSAKGSGSSGGSSGSYDLSVKADFGPACGDVKVYCAF